jgi:hypothetical protein
VRRRRRNEWDACEKISGRRQPLRPDGMLLAYDVAVHPYGKGGPPFYTSYIEVFGGKQVEEKRLFPVDAQDYLNLLPGDLKT